jgi:hypothetical protein
MDQVAGTVAEACDRADLLLHPVEGRARCDADQDDATRGDCVASSPEPICARPPCGRPGTPAQ